MKITLPWPHKDLNPNTPVHYMKRHRRKKVARSVAWAEVKAWICEKRTRPVIIDNEVSITFNPPDRRRRDLDNMLASCKAYLDGIADALGVDDSNFKLTIQKGEVVKGGQVVVEVL